MNSIHVATRVILIYVLPGLGQVTLYELAVELLNSFIFAIIHTCIRNLAYLTSKNDIKMIFRPIKFKSKCNRNMSDISLIIFQFMKVHEFSCSKI